MSLGEVIRQSQIICTVVVTKVDKQNNLIIYQKVADLKGKHPQEVIKHNIGRGGLRPGEWQEIMNWAEVGKSAIFFHNGSASETFFGQSWYQAYPNGEWWGMSHGEPFLLRSFAGKVDKLAQAVIDIQAGKEIIVSCMVDGDKEALHKKTAKVQRVKASAKLLDYNPKRDFVGWGGEDIRRIAGMPGFDRLAALGKTDADAESVSVVDFDGDGKPDLCLAGANKVLLQQNGGDGFSDVALPGLVGGCRSAVWADYNFDGKPDLLLATATGPKLYTNLGKGQFRDDSRALPTTLTTPITAAAWGDFDGDGKVDILLATQFEGLKLLRNILNPSTIAKLTPPKFGGWYFAGPFGSPNSAPFDTAFGPETAKEFDRKQTFEGKGKRKVKWEKSDYPDGNLHDLGRFGGDSENAAVYLSREIECVSGADIPASFGSDDTITVWLNGEKILSENINRAAAPDQNAATLKLKAGKNRLLLKICNGGGPTQFYFKPGEAQVAVDPAFADVSTTVGLGADGLCGSHRCDTLSVADFDGDGKPDVLLGAGSGLLLRNLGGKFECRSDSGISYRPGKVGPALCDFDGDGLVDVFVPQPTGSKLFRNLGGGKFEDVTGKAGDLGKLTAHAVGAAWGDFDNDGKPDLVVCCLRGANRFYRNAGNGSFEDQSAAIGLSQKIFNSQAAGWADLNNDGRLDLILNNEGQDSIVLFGAPKPETSAAKRTPVVVQVPAGAGKVTVTSAEGKPVATAELFGGDGRGGQGTLVPRFALAPGNYTLAIRAIDGKTQEKKLTVAESPMSVKVE